MECPRAQEVEAQGSEVQSHPRLVERFRLAWATQDSISANQPISQPTYQPANTTTTTPQQQKQCKSKQTNPTLFWDSRFAERFNTIPLDFLFLLAHNLFFPYLAWYTQLTVALGAQAFSPSAYLLDPFWKPTWLRGYRILGGWTAMTPRQGCWSHEEAVWWCFLHPPSSARWRSRCWRRSGGHRDTVSLKWCSSAPPGSRLKTRVIR